MRAKIATSKERFKFNDQVQLEKDTNYNSKEEKIKTIDAFLKIAFQHYLHTLKREQHGKDV